MNTPAQIDIDYLAFHLKLLNAFIAQTEQQVPFCLTECESEHMEFLTKLKELTQIGNTELLIQGQALFCRIVAAYPHLMPIVPRDLLWFFGGDCLHYMPDHEIDVFQRLDEARAAAQHNQDSFIYEKERAKAFGLH